MEVMVAHLEQAAEAGLPYAMLELAEVLERGGIVERDLDRARELYRVAADKGDKTALIRLVNMERKLGGDPAKARARVIDALRRLTETEEPPAWAFMQLGDEVLARDGRWAGEQVATENYRRALELDPEHTPARIRLAQFESRYIETPQDFETVASKLRHAVRAEGLTSPMQDLGNAFLCRQPTAPELGSATYWRQMEAFSGDSSIEPTMRQLRRLTAESDPLVYAQLQAQAINARSRSTANFLEIAGRDRIGEPFSGLRAVTRRQSDRFLQSQAKVDRRLGRLQKAKSHLEAALEAD
ncbi:hypothetical protein Salmuc_00824 [Salipiger mucosus DSM 16094]|uniref:TPR repeat protein, SEL1 subfamily n=1 Tax=Salipiger mucosus DSM 16094 TaxID=1123237 RepID=S9R231_9RHOB|nr:hypothetical protein Salmuc_00824 [Salipiger mucosus DSM 16094]